MVDANGQRMKIPYAIYLYVDTGGVQAFARFFDSGNLAVPCILGTEFIDEHVEETHPRKKRIVWRKSISDEELCPSPILSINLYGENIPLWTEQASKVTSCKRITIPAKSEAWVMANCSTPGFITLTPNSKLHRQHTLVVANGVMTIEPDEPVLVKVCNFGPTKKVLNKGTTPAFAEAYEGPILMADTRTDKVDNDDKASSSLEDIDLSAGPAHFHAQIREMLSKHAKMWDGTLGVIRWLPAHPSAPFECGCGHHEFLYDRVIVRDLQ